MKIKTRILLIVMLAMVGLSGKGQSLVWDWAKGYYGGYHDAVNSVCTDVFGNVYMTGTFSTPTIYFGSFTLTNINSTNDTFDIFLVKYDPMGNVLWAKSAGGRSWDFGEAVTTDIFGNVYLTGYYWSETIIFGSDTLTNFQEAAAVGDIFIVKYDANGNVLWAKSEGGNDNEAGRCVTTDNAGNVFVAGLFQSDSITIGTTTLYNYNFNSDCNIFIIKYDSSGHVLWAKGVGGLYDDWVSSIITDAAGNLYLAGCFQSDSITFDTITLTNSSANLINMYLAKLDANGNTIWAKKAGGISNDWANSITLDASGNLYLSGSFQSPTINFGIDTLINSGVNTDDIFITKYDSNGNVIWAKREGGIGFDAAQAIISDASGNIIMTGNFSGNTTTIGSTILTNNNSGSMDIFFSKYDSNGNVLWAKSIGGTCDDYPVSLANDGFNNYYVAGIFYSPTISFGNIHLTNNSNCNLQEIFISKLDATTGINEITPTPSLLLSPNPFTTSTTLTLQGTYHNPTLFIYNLLGQEVRSIPVGTNTKVTINREQLASGMYFYKLIDENKEVIGIGKMVVE